MNGALNFSRSRYDFQKHGYWHNWELGAMATDGSAPLSFFFTIPMPAGLVVVSQFLLIRIHILGGHISDCHEKVLDAGKVSIERNAAVVRVSLKDGSCDHGAGVYQYAVRLSRSDGHTSNVYHTTLRSEPFLGIKHEGKVRVFTFEFTQEFA
jgi:hypothetical protein